MNQFFGVTLQLALLWLLLFVSHIYFGCCLFFSCTVVPRLLLLRGLSYDIVYSKKKLRSEIKLLLTWREVSRDLVNIKPKNRNVTLGVGREAPVDYC